MCHTQVAVSGGQLDVSLNEAQARCYSYTFGGDQQNRTVASGYRKAGALIYLFWGCKQQPVIPLGPYFLGPLRHGYLFSLKFP